MNSGLVFPMEKVSVNGDPALLARLFDNLVNNAINHEKEGKRLDIELQKADGSSIVKITNFGSPILEEELNKTDERIRMAHHDFNTFTNFFI